jgi:mitogen-activated protein kinase kinase kinase
MKNLEHPHIVRYLGTESKDADPNSSDANTAHLTRRVFVFLEYVPGGSLSKMLRQFGAFGEPVVQRYTFQILRGLHYLHSKGFIHRDIKGANVLVSEAGVAKLADFGCSKQLQGAATGSMDESLRSIRGSIPWMAPEVIRQFGHGLDAVSISMTVAPKLHISALRPCPDCLITSGAIHGMDPRIDRKLSSIEPVAAPCNCFEQPKSASFATPASDTSTFAPLISRCMNPLLCK